MKTIRITGMAVSICFAALYAQETLKNYADKIPLNIGTCVGAAFIQNDQTYINTLKREFNTVVCENDMKAGALQPAQGAFNFTNADKLVAFARQNNMKIRGHTLVWHNQNPNWLSKGSWTRATLLAAMKAHINGVLNHFKGQIIEWDVVNEAFDDNNAGARRSSFWQNTIGNDFIDSAFTYAHQADPAALLFYNDYATCTVNAKSTAIYNMIKTLQTNGIPIHGIGFQSHQQTSDSSSSLLANMKVNFDRFAALGLKISITELDVRMPMPSDQSKLNAQAKVYRMIIQAALATPACRTFMMWGFTDKFSWIPAQFPGEGAACIYDENYQPKSAYAALLDVLKNPTPIAVLYPSLSRAGQKNEKLTFDALGNSVMVHGGKTGVPAYLEMFDLRGAKIAGMQVQNGSCVPISSLSGAQGTYLLRADGSALRINTVK
jgi:endo-1,4-beta-xylanase